MKDLLTSWKEIASYLGRTPRTVQRWERDSHLPVHRPPHKQSRLVVADTDELDSWAIEYQGIQDAPTAGSSQAESRTLSNQILHEIARKESTSTVFAALIEFAESALRCDFAEISLVDNRLRRLFHAAGARVPKTLVTSPLFSNLGSGFGACPAAVSTKQQVISVCIKSDPKWISLRALASKENLMSCWAEPIMVHGAVIGVVGAYFQKRRRPTREHLTCLELVSQIAGISLQMSGIAEPLDQFERDAAFIGLDEEFRVRAISREASRILDKSANEMVGQKLWDLYPNPNPFVVREYNKALTENITVAFEVVSNLLGSRVTVVARPSNKGLAVFFKQAAAKAAAAVA